MPAPPSSDVLAAGVVVFRPGRLVLLVHRPAYDDWSFPKGKLDSGEHAAVAAVREVAEETGLRVRLGPPLTAQRYQVGSRGKTVSYWTGRVVGDADVSRYLPNDEIDGVRWVAAGEAAGLLTYPRDRETLVEALALRRRTRAVLVLRHGKAQPRSAWHGDDRDRPLLAFGEGQADRLVPVLAAYDVARVVSSTSLRCVQTVEPYARSIGSDPETRRRLSEEDADAEGVAQVVDEVVEEVSGEARGAVVCTHRPVLAQVSAALGVPDPDLGAGDLLVVHLHRRRVVATERIQGV